MIKFYPETDRCYSPTTYPKVQLSERSRAHAVNDLYLVNKTHSKQVKPRTDPEHFNRIKVRLGGI